MPSTRLARGWRALSAPVVTIDSVRIPVEGGLVKTDTVIGALASILVSKSLSVTSASAGDPVAFRTLPDVSRAHAGASIEFGESEDALVFATISGAIVEQDMDVRIHRHDSGAPGFASMTVWLNPSDVPTLEKAWRDVSLPGSSEVGEDVVPERPARFLDRFTKAATRD